MRIALVQLNSVLDYEQNLKSLEDLLAQAKSEGAVAAFLPECFYSMSNGLTSTPHLIDLDRADCPHLARLRELAKNSKMALLGGSVAAKKGDQILNRALNISPEGELLASYDKRTLFACRLKDKTITESDIYTPGTEATLLPYQDLLLGLGICFDLRFSELAYQYRRAGANALTFASAFTVPTGKAHWHILNRARAIESQLFVISAAQWGRHNERISTFGHSLVIDPWGEVLLDLEEGVQVGVVDLNLDRVEEIRRSVLMNRNT